MTKRVLVVDDEVLNRCLIEEILDSEGYEAVHAETGEAALEVIAREQIDVVLLDVLMPGIDGIEVCRRIRTDLQRPLLPVVLISALSDAASRTRGKQAGADDFLTKPIHADELRVRTKNLLLLREYHAAGEAMRERAEHEARQWWFASSIATALAGCMSVDAVTARLHAHLERELGVERTALLEQTSDTLQLTAMAPPRPPAPWACAPPRHLPGARRVDLVTELAPTPELLGVAHVVALPIAVEDRSIGVCCIGRSRRFDDLELAMLDALTPHIANAIVNVRSHLETVADMIAKDHARDQAQAALALSEERHRRLFEGTPLPIWVLDEADDRIVAANRAFEMLCGYSRAQLREMTYRELEPAPDALPPEAPAGSAFLRCKEGRTIELDVTSHALMFEGRPVRVAIGVDVTQTRRVEEQLRQSQKLEAIGRLAGGVAHDFNNVLAAILANAELAREVLGDDHPVSQDLLEIESAAQLGTDVTRQLLAFSRRQRRELKTFELDPAVTGIEKLLRRLIGGNIRISVVLGSRRGAIRADVAQLEQLIMNLVINARDAMDGAGEITIETAAQDVDLVLAAQLGVGIGRYLTLSISDTGHGMTPEVRARMFEPFFTTKPIGKGTGLGLATVFGIVKESEGGILVESVVGRGTTIRVFLPQCDQATRARPTQQPPVTVAHGSEMVLLVEDNDSLRAALCRQLASWGYRFLEARSGDHALELLKLRTERVDLVITDVVMPGIDGRALAAQIMADRPATRVLFMSGFESAAQRAEEPQTEHFLEKPFTSQRLSLAIQQALAG